MEGPKRPAACTAFLDKVEASVQQAGVRDASSFEVEGFPYLRTDRFLAAWPDRLNGPSQKRLWVELLLRKQLRSREKEISCLPEESRLELALQAGSRPEATALLQEIEDCSRELLAADILSPEFFPVLFRSASAPEEYSLALRTAGIYPLTSLPVAWLTARAHDRMRDWQQRSLQDFAVRGELVRYLPGSRSSLSREELGEVLDRASANALELPRLQPAHIRRIVERFAPVLLQDVAGAYDRLGQVQWSNGELMVDGSRPALYYYLSYAFYDQRPVLQINYTGWYQGRRGPESPLIERGHLDGLTVRISLDASGRPFMVDIMNNCGCYHFFVPAKDRVRRIKEQPLAFDAFVPAWLPESFPAEPLLLRLNSGWHQVQKVAAGRAAGEAAIYKLLPYRSLEMLAKEERRRSMFDARGIAKGSERVEPLLLFPMGIPEVGAMRQRGHHALRLVGREHFADPWLFEDNFELRE